MTTLSPLQHCSRNNQGRPLIENITKEKHGNVYSEEYAKTLGGMIDNVEYLAGQLQNVTLSTTWPEPQDWSANRLLKQFKTISKLVASRTTRKAEREFFYVELGGFDTHNDVHETLDELFALVDEGLDVFVKEMKAQAGPENAELLTTLLLGGKRFASPLVGLIGFTDSCLQL